jgi:hypothetical protein
MAAILPFVKDPLVFGPEATRAMSVAFDELCRALNVSDTANGAERSHRDKNHRVGAARRMRPPPNAACLTKKNASSTQSFVMAKGGGAEVGRPSVEKA